MVPFKPEPRKRAWGHLLQTIGVILLLSAAPHVVAQAALLMEEPFGFFGSLNPTGHAAIYLQRVCADSPVHLRMCTAGEPGVVVSRYHGMGGYDWVAIPLIPYLYAVDDPTQVPSKVDVETVQRLRDRYREVGLGAFGETLPTGNAFRDGWVQLVGTAYDRRTYAFRFATTPEQDGELIARLNARSNVSHFNLLFNNCADFDRLVLNHYFPHHFGRTVFPDAGITTPKHVAYALVKYGKRHPEAQLSVLEIPQVPGYRRQSRAIHGVDESLIMHGYVIPIAVLNPYLAGGLLADYLVHGRYDLIPDDTVTVGPQDLDALTQPSNQELDPESNPDSTPASTGNGLLREDLPDLEQPSIGEPDEDASASADPVQAAAAPAYRSDQ
jgi:hypothetical protein